MLCMGDLDPDVLTELAGVADAETELGFAWALDDGQDDDLEVRARWWSPGRVTAAAVAAAVVVIGAAGAVAWAHLRRDTGSASAGTVVTVTAAAPAPEEPPPAARPSSAPVAAQPPPVTAETIAPTPKEPPPITETALAALDRQFVASMQAQGWLVTDPALMAHRAHQVCAMFQNGEPMSLVQQKMVRAGNGEWAGCAAVHADRAADLSRLPIEEGVKNKMVTLRVLGPQIAATTLGLTAIVLGSGSPFVIAGIMASPALAVAVQGLRLRKKGN